MDYAKLFELLMPLLMGGAGFAGGKYIDDKNRANMISPKDAMGMASGRRNEYKSMLGDVQSGATVNPALQQQRTATQTSLNRPVTPPPTFNPYKQEQGAPSNTYGQTNPELMQMLMQMVMGKNQNPTIGWGNKTLQGSLANRFGSRDMQGTLTPTPLPR